MKGRHNSNRLHWGPISAVGMLTILLLAGTGTHAGAQDLIHIPFRESRLAAQQERSFSVPLRLNDNPLLESYDVKYYGLDVELDNNSDHIYGSAEILVEVAENSFSSLVVELFRTLEVDRVLVDGAEVPFSHEGDELYMELSSPRDSGTLLSAEVFYGGETGEGLQWEMDDEWGPMVTYTLSEPFYAKDWFPCKEDLTDKADSVHVFITTDYGLKGISNGIHTGTTYFPDGKVQYQWKSNYPIAFYLISLAVADYQEYNLEVQPDGFNEPIFIQNFLYDKPGCREAYMEQIQATLPIMRIYCDRFGPYPFREEKYGHYLWPWGGGMEHQTLTGMGHFEFYLIAHELGHSWFGDYVTCATWQDIWINEGFATFAGYMATEVLGPEFADGEREYRFAQALLEPEGSVYVSEEEAENDARIFSGNLSYNKGMALLCMIRFELQDNDLFYLTLRNFLDRYAHGVATGLDFKEVLEETTGRDFTDFFDQWYFGAGYPMYDVSWEQEAETLTLQSTQSTSSAQTPLFKMSMEYRILHAEGDTVVRVFHDESVESYQFHIPYEVTGVVVDPDNQVLDGVNDGIKGAAITEIPPLFFIAPNPNRGSLLFRMNNKPVKGAPGRLTVEVLDLTGKSVYRKLFESCQPYVDYRVDLKRPVQGIYFVRFYYEGRAEVHKFLVE